MPFHFFLSPPAAKLDYRHLRGQIRVQLNADVLAAFDTGPVFVTS